MGVASHFCVKNVGHLNDNLNNISGLYNIF